MNDPRVVVSGDCIACGAKLPNDGRIFFCDECKGKLKMNDNYDWRKGLPTPGHPSPGASKNEERRLEAIRITERVSNAMLDKLRGDPGSLLVEATIATLGRLEKLL